MLEEIINALRGRKATIASVVGLLTVFSLNRGFIDQDVSELIMGMLTILGFGANYYSYKKETK